MKRTADRKRGKGYRKKDESKGEEFGGRDIDTRAMFDTADLRELLSMALRATYTM